MIIHSSETKPKVCEWRKVGGKNGIVGLKPMVQVHLQVALRRTKAVFLCEREEKLQYPGVEAPHTRAYMEVINRNSKLQSSL